MMLLALICAAIVLLALGWTRSKNPESPQTPVAVVPPGHPPIATPSAGQLKEIADRQAASLLADLAARPKDATLLEQIGNVYYDNRQFSTAIEYYLKAASYVPKNATLQTDLGNAYYYSGDVDRALEHFHEALKIDPRSANAYYNIGMIEWRDKGDPDAAVAAWKKLLQMNPNHPKRTEVEQMIVRVKMHAYIHNSPAANAQR